eukprot:TRINITY_DN10556_c0_g1_i1.p1 TRINITY_DN10556_c0_g1~~TRINITY_DN10556_c0_g1_i1.p1  ORF type:complete len:380 (-),score=79.52 TRINITY_DN10556_c0_g1_i1:70-1209(-)
MRVHDRQLDFPRSGVGELSVFSWNLLAPSLVRDDDPSDCLDWDSVRLPATRRWLERYTTCDILCFQEVEKGCSLEPLQEFLVQKGYKVVVQDKGDFPVVNVTFYKADRLRLEWEQHRSRVLLVGLSLPDGRVLGVANVHLEAGNTQHDEGQRRSQLESALKKMKARKPWCSIVCGDFNSSLSEGEPLHMLLTNGGLTRAAASGPTFARPRWADTFDHVFSCERLRAKVVLGSSAAAMKEILAGLPNAEIPSDHLPIAASFHVEEPATNKLSDGVVLPASLSEDVIREYVAIASLAKTNVSKRERKQQKRLEKAFLEALSENEASTLVQWREELAQLVEAAVALLTWRAAEKAKAHSNTAEVATNSWSQAAFDPGGSQED